MRKGKGQQKNEAGRQLKLFSWHAGELSGTPDGGTDTGTLHRVELLSHLERQRTLTENILERIVDYEKFENVSLQHYFIMLNPISFRAIPLASGIF
ncbi:MAG: hypothetical protein M0Q51_17120 [Bacteroidales bacterium]|nr:hypothetical protein [Bacteroidales bacterium]